MGWAKKLVATLLVLGSCSFDKSGIGNDGKSAADATVDSPGPADAQPDAAMPDSMSCGGSSLSQTPLNFNRCDVPAPGPGWLVDTGTWSLSTDTLTLVDSIGVSIAISANVVPQVSGGQHIGPDIAVFSVDTLTIEPGAVLKVTGTRALGLVSFGDIQLSGDLIAAGVDQETGPGGDYNTSCAIGFGMNGGLALVPSKTIGGGGGGGGGHQGAGGNGAIVTDGVGSVAAPGGNVWGPPTASPLSGGCRGGTGGNNGGAGGGGGGAVELLAEGLIEIQGRISVGGGGGQGGSDDHGGGGGGSGGTLLLSGATISVAGTLIGSGGGGGEGGLGHGIATASANGANAPLDGSQASGGDSGGEGGAGGRGGTFGSGDDGEAAFRNGNDPTRGGGGGGGGTGWIRLRGPVIDILPGSIIVPPSS